MSRRFRDEFAVHLAATVLDPPAESVARAHRPAASDVLLGNELAGLDAPLCRRVTRDGPFPCGCRPIRSMWLLRRVFFYIISIIWQTDGVWRKW